MEKMLVVVFDNELKAYDGFRALTELDNVGNISIYAQAVIQKNTDGTIVVKKESADFPVRTVGGAAIGALIGLLGGPIGVGIGAVTGTFAGSILDINRAGVDADFLDEVSAKLTPGKWAIVSDISEDWVTPIDSRMASVGGTVFRTTRKDVVHEQDVRDAARIKEDIAKLKAEKAKAKTEQKAHIQKKIDDLNKKLNSKLEQAKQRSERRKQEAKAKIEALEKKAAKAKNEEKAKIQERIAEIQEDQKIVEEAFDEFDRLLEENL